MADILYKKIGRKYVPVSCAEHYQYNIRPVDTFVLSYIYSATGTKYEYNVTPDIAGFVAASMMFREAIEKEIDKRSIASPQTTSKPWTSKQKKVLASFHKALKEAGILTATWWQQSASREISLAAIDALKAKLNEKKL